MPVYAIHPGTLADQIDGRQSALTVAELAGLLSCTQPTIRALIRSKALPAIKIGGAYRFDPQPTAAWLREQKANPRKDHHAKSRKKTS
jgi:excisionase family DNA binding protein